MTGTATEALPAWITEELIAATLEVWRPRSARPLTERDAIEILLNVGNLLDALGDADDEAVSSAGEGL